MTLWHVAWAALLVCGAVIPGPCTFDPQREWDCRLGEACPENFACAADGFCKSADVACSADEERCVVPGLARVGHCVPRADFSSSKTHCGACFARCEGAGVCEEGICTGAPPDGACVRARGNFDCGSGDVCADDGDGDEVGLCEAGGAGTRRSGEACDEAADCEGGLCVEGACSRPCDFGCPFGSVCDDDAIPGGLCAPGGDEVCG